MRSRLVSGLRVLALAALLAAAPEARATKPPPPAPPVPAPLTLPLDTTGYIQHVAFGVPGCDTCPAHLCPGEPVLVRISGSVPAGCVFFRGLRELEPASPAGTHVLRAEFVVDTCGRHCRDARLPFADALSWPGDSIRVHRVQLQVALRLCPDTGSVAIVLARDYRYEVAAGCAPPPPPPVPVDSLVRTFVTIRVVPEHRCPGDSLRLQLIKNGCPPCVHLTSFTDDSLTGLHVELDWRTLCTGLACSPETLSVPFGRFAAGSYTFVTSVAVHVLDAANPDSVIRFVRRDNFEVPRTCDSPGTGCVFPFLSTDLGFPECALQIPPGGLGELTLFARSPVALGGIQGRIDCPPPFRVERLGVPDGVAGLHLSWTPDGRGARYVVFSDAGALIPAGQAPVLRAAIRADAGALFGSRGAMIGTIEVASDASAGAVPVCDTRTIRIAGIGLCVTGDPEHCDANGDGHSDVRDLVLMTRCFRQLLSEPDSVRICRDCNGDSAFSFEDLFCCARHILRAPLVPRDSVHASDSLRVSLDRLVAEDGTLSVTVHVHGAEALGAAMVRLRYPADRWRADVLVHALSHTVVDPDWLPILDYDEPGLVQLGVLSLGGTGSSDIEFRFALIPTAPPQEGDLLEAIGADFAAPDGTVLTPAGALPSAVLFAPPPPPTGLPSSIELGAAQPNPFSRNTSFRISLPHDADVDLAVHDLAGRRVTTVEHGRVNAGRRSFTWDAGDARDGMYFVRLVVDGQVLSTRVVLVRDRP